jgi:hypothetical protein
MAQRRSAAGQRSIAQPAPTTAPAVRDSLSGLFEDDEGISIVKPESDALASITKSEVAMQIDAAHRYPRDVAAFMGEATALVTMSKETAESCIYALPGRGTDERGKPKPPITGPSVRLAEMIASSWRNLHAGARVIDIGARDVTAQALVWDLEKNLRVSIEVQRGIVTRKGDRFGDDMIRVTCLAAISIAYRNAVFRVIPRAFVNQLYALAEATATGAADGTFIKRRDELLDRIVNKRGIPIERVLSRLSVSSVGAITPELFAVLIGIGNAVKNNETTLELAFPPNVAAVKPGPAVSKGEKLDAYVDAHKAAKQKSEPPPANDDGQLTIAMVLDALVDADESWSRLPTARATAAINAWSPEDQRRAFNWAVAFVQTAEDQNPPEQPEFCLAPREPGEEG